MTECDESQSSNLTVPVAVAQKNEQSSDLDLVDATADVAEPSCTPECGSVTDLINNTAEQLCFIVRDDSRGLSEVANEDRNVSVLPKSPSNGGKTGECFLGMDGQICQKRGRFIIWPVSLGEERHV